MNGGRSTRDRTDPSDQTDRATLRVPAASRSGYTLIELISVAALATVLIALAVAGYHTWTRDTAVDAAQTQVRAMLERARGYALAHSVETRFSAVQRDSARSDALVIHSRTNATSPWLTIITTNALPNWIVFGTGKEQATKIIFRSDGSCLENDSSDPPDQSDQIGWLTIAMYHKQADNDARYRRVIEVNRRTGLARERPPGDDR
ncbi:MAG: hypothetical protein GX826_12975 [Gammaproteobacteria bacterium]|nr:hypothetical protein [Gammaproteobacteria bacterium]